MKSQNVSENHKFWEFCFFFAEEIMKSVFEEFGQGFEQNIFSVINILRILW